MGDSILPAVQLQPFAPRSNTQAPVHAHSRILAQPVFFWFVGQRRTPTWIDLDLL